MRHWPLHAAVRLWCTRPPRSDVPGSQPTIRIKLLACTAPALQRRPDRACGGCPMHHDVAQSSDCVVASALVQPPALQGRSYSSPALRDLDISQPERVPSDDCMKLAFLSLRLFLPTSFSRSRMTHPHIPLIFVFGDEEPRSPPPQRGICISYRRCSLMHLDRYSSAKLLGPTSAFLEALASSGSARCAIATDIWVSKAQVQARRPRPRPSSTSARDGICGFLCGRAAGEALRCTWSGVPSRGSGSSC